MPTAGVVLIQNHLYGTTAAGGSTDAGVVFAYDLNTNRATVLHSLRPDKDGKAPGQTLLAFKALLYGSASDYGPAGNGTVFSIPPEDARSST